MHLLFDLDGTLTDPFQGIIKSIQHALVALGHPAPPANDLRWCIGPPLRQVFARLLDTQDASVIESAVL
ncbi:MAG: HAD hydrolase-like protein, partial [Verrucomicrobia bacterium]|nr:HAD hydrolase-like protein [Verrucomicrobiota bacterium]